MIVSSEVGTVDLDGHGTVARRKISEGQMVCVDPTAATPIQDDATVKTFIANPKAANPDAKMPAMKLEPQQLDDLVAYMSSLK